MKPKTMILMVIAIVCGLGASYLTSRLLAERGEPEEAPKVSVLVAKQTVNVGTSLKKPEQLFEAKEYPKGAEPKEALNSLDQLKGKFAIRNLRKGDFVTSKDINDNPQPLELPEGMQGVGLRVSAEHIAGGFAATPGSRVDIYWTTKGNNQIPAQCGTLLQNVLVVAADTINSTGDDRRAIVAQVVTLALTEPNVAKLNLAKENGILSMAVRRNDEEVNKEKGAKVTLSDLLKEMGATPVTPPRPQVDPPVVVKAPKVDPKVEPKSPPVVPVVKAKPAPANKRKHVVVINDGNGKSRTQTFWIYDDGKILLDGHVPEEFDNNTSANAPSKAKSAAGGPVQQPHPGGPSLENDPTPGSGPAQPRKDDA